MSHEVVEFGDTEKPVRRRLPRWNGVRLDDRAVPAIAGLGAVAVFVSFLDQWQLTSVDTVQPDGLPVQEMEAGLRELGAWGTGYLMGVFAVVVCATLALFGAPAVRQHARLAGLAVSGSVLALLVAVAAELGRSSMVIHDIFSDGERQLDLSYRPGVYLAFAGVAALGLALFLAGRLPPAQRKSREQRTVQAPDEPAEPADLTVRPATPFVPTPDP